VATSHVKAHHGRHRADTDCLAWGKDSETQIKPFNEIEKRKELDGDAVGREVLSQLERRLSAIRREGDDVIAIFEVAVAESVQEWTHNMTDAKITRKFDALTESDSLEFEVPMICLATGCVSRQRDGDDYLIFLQQPCGHTRSRPH